MTSNLEETLKTILIYLEKESDPVPLKFYPGTGTNDIANTIKETVGNIKAHSQKDSLKTYQKQSQQALDIENLDQDALLELSRIVLAEEFPEDVLDEETQRRAQTLPEADNIDHDEIFSGQSTVFHDSNSHRIYKSFTLKSHIETLPPVVEKAGPKDMSSPKKRLGSVLEGLKSNKSNKSSPAKPSWPRVINLEDSNSQYVIRVSPSEDTRPRTGKWTSKEIGTKALDGTNPQIYSNKVAFGPFSFLTGTKAVYNQRCPPPVYESYEDSCRVARAYNKEDMFKIIEITATGEAKLIDTSALKAMKGVFSELIKKILWRIATGKGIFGIAFPVRVFEPQAFHEKLLDWQLYLANYLPLAAQSTDPVERIKYVMTFIISSMHNAASRARRPFNALMGETTQIEWPELGIKGYVEQTGHHPPSVNYLIEGKGFKVCGKGTINFKIEPNAAIIHLDGSNSIQFSDGQLITFEWPYLKAAGMMIGERLSRFVNIVKVIDVKNKLKAIVKLGDRGDIEQLPKKRVDVFSGKIFRYDPSHTEGKKLSQKQIAKIDNSLSDMTEKLCDVYGQVYSYLKIDGKEYWNRDTHAPIKWVPAENALPSDNRYREDLIWLKRGNLEYAEEWKLKLEEQQRNDRKIRNKRKGKHEDD